MSRVKSKIINKRQRKAKIKARVKGTAQMPRLSVFRSNTSVFLQIINDAEGKTLVSAHSRDVKNIKTEAAKVCAKEFELGKMIAEKALAKKIEKIVFDRGGCKYHGRVKAVADGAREAGLKF